MPPKVLAKNVDRPSGILPVNAATRAAAATKGPSPRLKLEIRRLPPGLTLTEFESILGEEWKLGNGKIDWREYRQGKVRQSMGKIPEQSRCYVHLVNESLVQAFEARFLAVELHDKAGTHRSPDLKHLPPTIGFAPNQRTPLNAKARTDTRQGTIDQDPEFIAFLEAETQPISKPAALDSVNTEKKETEKEGIKSTPLIEALREKKANKAKIAETKAAERKDGKGHARTDSKDNSSNSKKDGKEDKAAQNHKVDQVSKEAVKALNKQVATKAQQQQQRPASPQQPQGKISAQAKSKKATLSSKQQNATPTQPSSTPTKVSAGASVTASQSSAPSRAPRPRGNAEGIKKMLQKDLGIKPKSTVLNTSAAKAPQQDQTSKQAAPVQPPAASKQRSHKAYLKHANPSQGMTEILIQQALSQYGDITSVTIDPRKGTAVALFKDADGLKKAVEAKKVSVANGNVEVVQFQERGAGGNGGKGGFRGGKAGARGGREGVAAGAISTAAPTINTAKTDSTS